MKSFKTSFLSAMLLACLVSAFTAGDLYAQIAFDQIGPYGGTVSTIITMPDGRLITKRHGSAASYESTDDGLTWSWIDGGVPEVLGLNTVVHLGDNTVYAALYGDVFRSVDNGDTWNLYEQHLGLAEFMVSSSMAVNNDSQLFMGGGMPATLFTMDTTDGSWTTVSEIPGMLIPQYVETNGSSEIHVYGIPDDVIYSGMTAHSSDLGQTWTTKLVADLFSSMSVANDGSVLACSWFGVARLSDLSSDWDYTLGGGDSCTDLVVTSDGSVLAVVNRVLSRSVDNGVEWSQIPYDSAPFDFELLPSGTILAATLEGLERSEDNGLTWSSSDDGLAMISVRDMLRTSSGEMLVAVGDGVKTSDAMAEIDPILFDFDQFDSVIEMVEEDNGDVFAFSWQGDVALRTTGATDWTQLRNGDSRVFNTDVYDETIALAGSQELWFSSDNGATWVDLYPLIPGSGTFIDGFVHDVALAGGGSMYVALEEGLFKLELMTFGPEWTSLKSDQTLRVHLLDNGTLIARSETGLSSSSDSGLTWTDAAYDFEFASTWDPSPFFEAADGTLFIPECDGLVRSTDSGVTWLQVDTWPLNCSTEMHLDDDGRLFLATSTGIHVSASISVETQASHEIPRSSEMLAVYPQPVSHSATFLFSVEKTSSARIEVYNTLGQMVLVAHEGSFSPGQQRITADFSRLTKGLYLTRLTIDGQPVATGTIIRAN